MLRLTVYSLDDDFMHRCGSTVVVIHMHEVLLRDK